MKHIVLAGDSIFDNERYVNQNESVIDQLRKKLPSSYNATLLAVDGDVTSDVSGQLDKLPFDVTHLFISCGGNDALQSAGALFHAVESVGEAMEYFTGIKSSFQNRYHKMLDEAKKKVKNIAICTIYDSMPGMEQKEITALSMFNEVILREAFAMDVPVLDLRLTCNDKKDYSSVSPIEPSKQGGRKISKLILEVIESYNYDCGRTHIYA